MESQAAVDAKTSEVIAASGPYSKSRTTTCIRGARLPRKPLLWDIHLEDAVIHEIKPHQFDTSQPNDLNTGLQPGGIIEAAGRLVAPSLCHAHIHLDKCFLLQDPRYIDLQITSGDFDEAMELTSKAKARFSNEDLLRRGRQLIEESIQAGVTSMRAFVEVDAVVGLKSLDAGLELKDEFSDRCDIQICAFAQLALFSGDDNGQAARTLMKEAANRKDVECLGSTPYVEDSDDKGRENIRWITQLALDKGKHLDLHLDYFLDVEKKPLIWDVMETLHQLDWPSKEAGNQLVTLGHCTRLTHFSPSEWQRICDANGSLPISFVSLPTSDLFMMRAPQQQHRGTLPIPTLIRDYGLQAAIAVNNVGNAFTPQGSCDPLNIASLGIGLYGAGAEAGAELLYDTVSSRAKKTTSTQNTSTLDFEVGQPADLVIFPLEQKCSWRSKTTIAHVVYEPPPTSGRVTVRRGMVVSSD